MYLGITTLRGLRSVCRTVSLSGCLCVCDAIYSIVEALAVSAVLLYSPPSLVHLQKSFLVRLAAAG